MKKLLITIVLFCSFPLLAKKQNTISEYDKTTARADKAFENKEYKEAIQTYLDAYTISTSLAISSLAGAAVAGAEANDRDLTQEALRRIFVLSPTNKWATRFCKEHSLCGQVTLDDEPVVSNTIKKTLSSKKAIPYDGQILKRVTLSISKNNSVINSQLINCGKDEDCIGEKIALFLAEEIDKRGYSLDATFLKVMQDKEYNAFIQTSELMKLLMYAFIPIGKKELNKDLKKSGFFPSHPYPVPVWGGKSER